MSLGPLCIYFFRLYHVFLSFSFEFVSLSLYALLFVCNTIIKNIHVICSYVWPVFFSSIEVGLYKYYKRKSRNGEGEGGRWRSISFPSRISSILISIVKFSLYLYRGLLGIHGGMGYMGHASRHVSKINWWRNWSGRRDPSAREGEVIELIEIAREKGIGPRSRPGWGKGGREGKRERERAPPPRGGGGYDTIDPINPSLYDHVLSYISWAPSPPQHDTSAKWL